MFKQAGKKKGNVNKYQFWQHHNEPIELWSTSVINAEYWKYSSARNFQEDHTILEIDNIGFIG